MNCQETERSEIIWEKMSLALDGMLSSNQERELQAHLAHCPSCRAEWEALQAVSSFLSQAPLASPGVDLALRVEERLRLQGERRRWVLGLMVTGLWLGLVLSGLVGSAALLGWLLRQQPVLASVGVHVLVQLLLACQATLRGLLLVAGSLPVGWLSIGVNGCLVVSLVVVCLWAWLAFGRQQRRTGAA